MRKFISALFFFLIIFSACNEAAKDKETVEAGQYHPDSVTVKEFIKLGGEEQYVEINSTSDQHPVLLFIHGGPGWPQTPHLRYFNADLAKSFTLVSWDQTGCGQSLINNPAPQRVSASQIIEDAHELTVYLKNRFKKDKIYIAGFSWGSVIGLQLVNQYPADYVAYFGISQVIDINRSIDVSREWIKEQATLKKDTAVLRQVKLLERKDTSYCKTTLECFFKKYELLSVYNGAVFTKKAQDEILEAETQYEDYKNYDWLKGFMFSAEKLSDALFTTDLKYIRDLKVPVYFLVGRHDWSVPAVVTEEYFATLKAPKKEMVWFENSGHEVSSEEAAKFNAILIERIEK